MTQTAAADRSTALASYGPTIDHPMIERLKRFVSGASEPPAVQAEIVGELDRPGVAVLEVDVRDRDRALAALTGADLLMNCTSFALFDDVFALALAAGVDYADLISEPSDHQREAARDAGITAISGLGATPGLSNVLVAHAAGELDDVHDVEISWLSSRTAMSSPASSRS